MVAEYKAEWNQTSLTAVLVGGIAGSGKSLLCQALVNLLGGQHLSQDEVEAKYAGQNVNVKPFHFFLQLVESTAARSSVRYLFIDSKLSSKSARECISAAVACGFAQRKAREGAVAEDSDSEDHNNLKLVLLSLSLDSELCATRIIQRSSRHVALIPQVAHVRVILDAMCKDVEPVTHEEARLFDVFSDLDMKLPANLLVTKALEVLPCTEHHSTEQVSSAVRVAQKLEKDLSLRWTTLYWMVEVLPQQASMMLTQLAPLLSEMYEAKAAKVHGSWQQLEDLHITVLWTGSNMDAEQKLQMFEGQEISFSITSICCDLNLGLMALRVCLDDTLTDLCENPDPHITVAKIPGVTAKHSNDMLLRQRNGDTSVVSKSIVPELQVRGVVQRGLSVDSMGMATAALAMTLLEGNPICELGLSASSKSLDVFATEGLRFSPERLQIASVTTTQPLQHCRWPPRLPGKVWFTIHEQPLSQQSRLMLEALENDGILSSLHVAVCYVYIAENLLQKTYPKLLGDLEQRLNGRCLNSLLHAYHCINSWHPKTAPSSNPSFCIQCLGAGEHCQKLEQGLVDVIKNKLGWTLCKASNDMENILILRVDFKEDWILLTLPLPTNQLAGGSDGYSKLESTTPKNDMDDMTSQETNGHPEVNSAVFTVEEGFMKIDGSFLGGRGHILRSAATYAAVLGTSVSIHNVRAGSIQTGLQQRDIAILDGLKKIAGVKIDGGLVGSSHVSFLSNTSDLDASSLCSFTVTTRWALTHAVQAMIPAMLARSAALGGSEVEVCFEGSTNLCHPKEGGFEILPQIEYVKLVLLPMLRRLFGITVTLDVRRKGFASDGEVWLRVSTFQWPLPCFDLVERGEVATLSGIIYSSAGIPRNVPKRFLKGECRKKDAGAEVVFNEALGKVQHQHFTFESEITTSATAGCGLVLCITTTSGCCFGGDSMGRKGFAAEMVGEEAARQALHGWQRGGCADEHLEDQLVVFMTLAMGTSRLRLGSSSTSRSLNMQTALWLAERFGAAVRIAQDAKGPILEIDGIGDRFLT